MHRLTGSFNALSVRGGIRIATALVASWLLAASALDAAEPVAPPSGEAAKTVVAATDCARCHTDIYGFWSGSRHNQSARNVSFLEAEAAFQKQADCDRLPHGKDFCKTCHSPALGHPESEAASEGVRCAFCHSIKDVQIGRRPSPFVLETGDTKYGPGAGMKSPAHPIVQSNLFADSRLCAGCHEWRSDDGLAILSTYSEWKESGLESEGTHCQTCHMAEAAGNVVDPKLLRDGKGKINTHKFTGGHNASQLHDAVKVDIKSIVREGERLRLRVGLANIGAGHYFPTGMPTRRVELEIVANWGGGKNETKKELLMREFVDAAGNPLRSAHDIFLRAADLKSDTRLKPEESRDYEFTLEGPKDKGCRVEVRLVYYDDPLPGQKEPYRSVFYQQFRSR